MVTALAPRRRFSVGFRPKLSSRQPFSSREETEVPRWAACRNVKQAVDSIRALATHGGDRRSAATRSLDPDQGGVSTLKKNTAQHWLARLDRDRPDLAARVRAAGSRGWNGQDHGHSRRGCRGALRAAPSACPDAHGGRVLSLARGRQAVQGDQGRSRSATMGAVAQGA